MQIVSDNKKQIASFEIPLKIHGFFLKKQKFTKSIFKYFPYVYFLKKLR